MQASLRRGRHRHRLREAAQALGGGGLRHASSTRCWWTSRCAAASCRASAARCSRSACTDDGRAAAERQHGRLPGADGRRDARHRRARTSQTPTRSSQLGAKGAGEAGTAGAPGAVMNAINDALAPFGARVSVAADHAGEDPARARQDLIPIRVQRLRKSRERPAVRGPLLALDVCSTCGVTWSQVAGGTRVLRPTLAGDHRGTPPSPRQHRVRPAHAWATANGACARGHRRRPAGISGGLPSRSPRCCRGRWFGCAIAGPIRGRPGGRRPQALLTR